MVRSDFSASTIKLFGSYFVEYSKHGELATEVNIKETHVQIGRMQESTVFFTN